jgi:D-alanyl-D-alanine carboxypeptidase
VTAQPTSPDLLHYSEMVDLHDYLPINVDLRSAEEMTMVSLLGSPQLPLTTHDQPERASPLVKRLLQRTTIGKHIPTHCIGPALKSLEEVLRDAFEREIKAGHDLANVLGTAGTLNVRYRKPTSGVPSTQISNHAWGTAIDLRLVGHSAPANTGDKIPRFISVLLPIFHEAGWYSGIAFHDTMHFEVSDGLIRQWAKEGRFKP